jgi:uncharacterized membrane protein
VAVYFGGLTATAAVFCTVSDGGRSIDADSAALVRTLFVTLVVPSLVLAIVMGLLLLLQHPLTFLRLRWLQVKLAALLVGIPAAHLAMSSQLRAIRAAASVGQVPPGQLQLFLWELVAVLVFTGAIMVLGRHKPRLGQNWAKAFAGREREQA